MISPTAEIIARSVQLLSDRLVQRLERGKFLPVRQGVHISD